MTQLVALDLRRKQVNSARRVGTRAFSKRELGLRVLKGLAAGSLAVGAGAAIEVTVRPEGGSPDQVASLAGDRDPLVVAQEWYRAGGDAVAARDYEAAAVAYTNVLTLAPRSYTLCMKSLLARRDVWIALERRDAASEDFRREFGWGRGVRWPGWYIIAAILFRNEIVRGT